MIRSFRKQAGMPVEQWLEMLGRLEQALAARDAKTLFSLRPSFRLLAGFYANLYEMAKGYGKDAQQRAEYMDIVQGWREDVEKLNSLLKD